MAIDRFPCGVCKEEVVQHDCSRIQPNEVPYSVNEVQWRARMLLQDELLRCTVSQKKRILLAALREIDKRA